MSDFELLPLACPSCGAPLAAEEDDVVFYCTACRNGYRLDETARPPLVPVPVSFLAVPERAAERHLPFWVLPARLEVHDRSAAGGALRAIVSLFTGGDELPAGGAVFAVPAFRLPLDAACRLASRYTRLLSTPGEAPAELLGERLTGGVYTPGDAETLAEYTLLAGEVAKSDTLRDISYTLDFGEPRLVGVPFERAGGGDGRWRDLRFGEEV